MDQIVECHSNDDEDLFFVESKKTKQNLTASATGASALSITSNECEAVDHQGIVMGRVARINTRLITTTDDPFDAATVDSAAAQEEEYPSKQVNDDIFPEETVALRQILIVRILFSAVLVLSTIGIAVAVYFFVKGMEDKEFEYHFYSDSDKIILSIGHALRTTLSSADVMAANLMAVKHATNSSFPFVTLPNYALQTAKLKHLSKAYSTGVQLVVTDEQREEWEDFAAVHGPPFVAEAWRLQAQDESFQGSLEKYPVIRREIFSNYPDVAPRPKGSGPYLVSWQSYPIIYEENSAPYNYDLLSFLNFRAGWNATLTTKRPSISGFSVVDLSDPLSQFIIQFLEKVISEEETAAEPVTTLIYPILDQEQLNLELTDRDVEEGELVGTFSFGFFWRDLLRDILPDRSRGILVVTELACSGEDVVTFTYEINGAATSYLGVGDLSEVAYHRLGTSVMLEDIVNNSSATERHYTGLPLFQSSCPIKLRIYPSEMNESDHHGPQPVIFTICSVLVFLFAGVLFALYDLLVKRRQRKVAHMAARSSAIVSDLFPKELHDRLYEAKEGSVKENGKKNNRISWASATYSKERTSVSSDSVLAEGYTDVSSIADIYPSATILYAGIAGFASWSSKRDPRDVFKLLEALFGSFDEIAERQGIYKIETSGDSYVAVCGLPKERPDHAVRMARFATDCRDRSVEIMHSLDFELGLGTANLYLRFGLASGPVGGGILRGQRARFQLFGDTVFTAEFLERTGEAGRIQASQTTADLLCAAGKENWMNKRPDKVGMSKDNLLVTFWIHAKTSDSLSTLSFATSASKTVSQPLRKERMINWFSEELSNATKQIVESPETLKDGSLAVAKEVKEGRIEQLISEGEMSKKLILQIQFLVEAISSMHMDHPFHNFEHAFHIASSLSKMLDQVDCEIPPVTRFAAIFAALIHEIDHPGLDNEHLSSSHVVLREGYRRKSMTQHHAFELAWIIFSDKKYQELRSRLCPTDDSLACFRQLVLDCVIATDVMNPILSAARKRRWEKVFESATPDDLDSSESKEKTNRRRTTVILEHLILAAHLTHTLQVWSFYIDWNNRLFTEMAAAYAEGKLEKDPADSWFDNELMLFNNVVIPLATKIQEIVRPMGKELLNHAEKNRKLWKIEGKTKVEGMRAAFTGEKRVHFA